MAKSATEKLNSAKQPKWVVLEKNFAGIKAGERMFVATPQIVDDYIREIPRGETRDVKEMRADLASRSGCDATCPVSTAIFVRICAEAAITAIDNGVHPDTVSPFWRLLAGNDKISRRLPVDPDWIDERRRIEAVNDGSKKIGV